MDLFSSVLLHLIIFHDCSVTGFLITGEISVLFFTLHMLFFILQHHSTVPQQLLFACIVCSFALLASCYTSTLNLHCSLLYADGHKVL
jgi:hypothetical protein